MADAQPEAEPSEGSLSSEFNHCIFEDLFADLRDSHILWSLWSFLQPAERRDLLRSSWFLDSYFHRAVRTRVLQRGVPPEWLP